MNRLTFRVACASALLAMMSAMVSADELDDIQRQRAQDGDQHDQQTTKQHAWGTRWRRRLSDTGTAGRTDSTHAGGG